MEEIVVALVVPSLMLIGGVLLIMDVTGLVTLIGERGKRPTDSNPKAKMSFLVFGMIIAITGAVLLTIVIKDLLSLF